jgi:hypothetical protein
LYDIKIKLFRRTAQQQPQVKEKMARKDLITQMQQERIKMAKIKMERARMEKIRMGKTRMEKTRMEKARMAKTRMERTKMEKTRMVKTRMPKEKKTKRLPNGKDFEHTDAKQLNIPTVNKQELLVKLHYSLSKTLVTECHQEYLYTVLSDCKKMLSLKGI